MAKKKGKSSGNSDTAERSDAVEVQTVEEPTTTTDKSEPQQLQDTPVEDMDVDDLRAELSLARAEIARLKSELGSKGQERDTPLKGSKPADVQELQEKLQRLRKEQQEADAARDKAWKQLKAVVQEISSLANPDYLQSLQVKAHE
ncbi:hypothetical protein OEZ85_008654 [Tetradesmus obliquus]|uniref:Uncharacterized protein n=1 Tax=Tetradesmus obliquus TaxID=3088 RepID=A0ABY8TLP9_TETOB|nr:hypothetical protein OEZ85_008654 [Tetradesmus obliquus]